MYVFNLIFFWHESLELQEIAEDYMHIHFLKSNRISDLKKKFQSSVLNLNNLVNILKLVNSHLYILTTW